MAPASTVSSSPAGRGSGGPARGRHADEEDELPPARRRACSRSEHRCTCASRDRTRADRVAGRRTGRAPRGHAPASAPAEDLGHQAPQLRRRNRVVSGVRDDRPIRSSPSGIASAQAEGDAGGATAARATRPHRGSGIRLFALAGGTSLHHAFPEPAALQSRQQVPETVHPEVADASAAQGSVLREGRGTTTLRHRRARPDPARGDGGGRDRRSGRISVHVTSEAPACRDLRPYRGQGGSVRILL